MFQRVLAVLCTSIFLSIVSGCAFGLTDPQPPPPSAKLAEVESYVREVVRDGDPPSVSVAVMDHGKVVYDRAFGFADGPRRIPAGPDTTYRWFSVTKLFTAVAILQLVEEGKVELEAPAGRYVPLVSQAFGAHARELTIARLLSHSSGLGDIGNDIVSWVHVAGPHPQELEILRRHLAAHAELEPRHVGQGRYSNLGYLLLGGVIEAVTGRPYTEVISRRILEPLGMASTAFYYDEPRFSPATRHAVGSHPTDLMGFMASLSLDAGVVRECKEQRYWFNGFHPNQSAPSGLVGTSADALRFASALLHGGERGGQRILSAQTVAAMTAPRADVLESPVGRLQGFSFGYAWFVGRDPQGRRVFVHGGGGMAFTSMMMLWPDLDRAVFVAANGSYFDGAMGQRVAHAYGSLTW